jgi:ribose/xylose/arabinose/galactoside ABC-type transport system permease subunit
MQTGSGQEVKAIIVVALGGVSLSGGAGDSMSAVVGARLLTAVVLGGGGAGLGTRLAGPVLGFLRQGLLALGVGNDVIPIVVGGPLVGAVAMKLGLATRIAAEIDAQSVKTCCVDSGFERGGRPASIVIAGGKKPPELEAAAKSCRRTRLWR